VHVVLRWAAFTTGLEEVDETAERALQAVQDEENATPEPVSVHLRVSLGNHRCEYETNDHDRSGNAELKDPMELEPNRVEGSQVSGDQRAGRQDEQATNCAEDGVRNDHLLIAGQGG